MRNIYYFAGTILNYFYYYYLPLICSLLKGVLKVFNLRARHWSGSVCVRLHSFNASHTASCCNVWNSAADPCDVTSCPAFRGLRRTGNKLLYPHYIMTCLKILLSFSVFSPTVTLPCFTVPVDICKSKTMQEWQRKGQNHSGGVSLTASTSIQWCSQ